VVKNNRLSEQRRDVGSGDEDVKGALLRAVSRNDDGSLAAADVALAIVNEIGFQEVIAADAVEKDNHYERDLAEGRIQSLWRVAGRLGIDFPVRVIHDRPIMAPGGRTVEIPQHIAQNPEAVAAQLAIISTVDQDWVVGIFPGEERKTLSIDGGYADITSALKHFRND
jgi:hypothetical protein